MLAGTICLCCKFTNSLFGIIFEYQVNKKAFLMVNDLDKILEIFNKY